MRVRVLAAMLGVAACSIGETTHEHVTTPGRVQSETRTCESAIVKPDLAGLKPCGDGKGHCYDGAKVPISGLPPCDGNDVCVPDKVLQANGERLRSCKFFIGDKPGVCFSSLVDDVSKHLNELQRDTCDEDERCVPCIDPTNGEDTHTCDPMGVYEKACVGGVGAGSEVCCHGAGTCIQEEGAPEDQRDSLGREVCPAGKLCAPAALVDGNPVKCSVTGLGFSGVCVDVCFSKMLGSVGKVMRGDCGPTEVCVPCVVGKSEGVPGCD